MLKIKQFVFNPFGVSTFIIYDTDTLDAITVDPGMTDDSERYLFDTFIETNKLKLRQIVNTHMHLDHCFGDNYVRDRYGVKIAANPADAALGHGLAAQARMFGMILPENETGDVEIDTPVAGGDKIKVGNYDLEVLDVPGHSPGSIALYSHNGHFAIVGDALFRGAIGRTDLPGGNHSTLLDSIRTKLYTLPDETMVLPGHEAHTTIGNEKASNPYTL